MFKKISVLLILALIILAVTGCGGGNTEEPTDPGQPAAEEPAVSEKQQEKVKVAIVFPGSIKDMGWNQSGYEAIMEAKDTHGIEVSYQENVGAAELKDVLRNYAAEGYDLIIGGDLYFSDPVLEVAPEFPDKMFGIIGGYQGAENVAAITSTNWESTYLAGSLAGLVSENNKIGILTATDSPIAKQMVAGFKGGAQTTNSNVEVIHAFVGSWNDVVKGKELVKSMVKEGVDVVYTQCGQVNTGAVEACAEAGILAIGAIVDMHHIAPDTVVSSAIAPPGAMVSNMISMFLDGTLEGKAYEMGVKDGVEDLAPFYNFEDKLSQEVKDKINQVRQDIIDGKITKPTAE